MELKTDYGKVRGAIKETSNIVRQTECDSFNSKGDLRREMDSEDNTFGSVMNVPYGCVRAHQELRRKRLCPKGTWEESEQKLQSFHRACPVSPPHPDLGFPTASVLPVPLTDLSCEPTPRKSAEPSFLPTLSPEAEFDLELLCKNFM